ncbi:MAG: type II secretion system protein [Lachnospiraceae bacterium]|jgi:prepilin-type N-terminal cleavage/methylation domain-containing protein|nr:type II secretion system protein [Lachnospiraceae bacterium]
MRLVKEKVKLNNSGFSLVELIIVIAIMAILVGVVGSQVIPYLENSRRAKDVQIISTYATAGIAAYSLHPDSAEDIGDELVIEVTPGTGGTGDVFTCTTSTGAQVIADEMKVLIDKDYVTNPNTSFESKAYKKVNKIVITLHFDTREVEVYGYDTNGAIFNENNVFGQL